MSAQPISVLPNQHGPAGPAELRNGAWVRSCLCGREFESWQHWRHVPALYDHLATVPKETLSLPASSPGQETRL